MRAFFDFFILLEEILIRFRENKFDDLLKTENHAELEKLNDQLEAIGHHIQLIKEEARAEKENTKGEHERNGF